ncbi:MAG: DUF4215 domain-containing protein [Deltaproteobacteria bacterium]|nr:DUF4215 domain-containing protein [Deltaproteobacteria bacterium]
MSTHKSTTSCLFAVLLALAAFAPACGGGGGDDNDVDADVEEGMDIEDDVPDAEDGREDRGEADEGGADGDEGGADADDVGDAETEVSPTCGDGTVDADEDCDDANTVNTDDCTNACLDAACGDGYVWTGHEACDDGNTTGGDGCSASCALESCGNGTIDAGETCDDGNTIDTDDCPGNCQSAACGDGYVWAGHEDCDGSAPRACTTTCSSAGTQLCTACAWETTCTPPVETCNDADDDCDTAVDNGFPCRIGASVSCTTSCLSTGAGTCTAACQLPLPADCTPPVEICNGVDDDCDAETDEGYPCAAGATIACTNSCGGSGTGLCAADCSLPAAADCSAPPETCNGLDDDCAGGPDDIYACVQGATVSCTTACLSTGTGACSATCDLPAAADCVAPAEACNGADDDCDTVIDDGFSCTSGASSACTAGTCTGTRLCDGTSCSWGTCTFGAAPTNDACGGALTDISTGGTFVGNTCAALNDYSYSCGGTIGASPDVVFTLHITSPRDVIIDTVGSGFDGMLFIRHTGTCPGTTADRCDDNSGGTGGAARIQWTNMPAGDYWVILDGPGAGNRGDYVLNVFVATPPPPANDTCATATALPDSGTYNGQTATGSDDHVPSCSATTGGRDVWYSFTLAGSEIVYLDVVDGNSWNTVLEVRQGTCGGTMTSAACNDDACTGSRSQWFGILPAGTYYVVIDGAGAAQSGAFSLLYQHSGGACAAALPMAADGNYDGTTAGAGADHNASCGGTSAPDVDYWFAACNARRVTATTCNTTTAYNTLIYFRGGSCGGAGTELGCNNDAACAAFTGASTLGVNAAKGLNFLIVDGYFGAQGAYRVNMTGL